MTQRIAPITVACSLCRRTIEVSFFPDLGMASRQQWLNAMIYNEFDADELAPQAVAKEAIDTSRLGTDMSRDHQSKVCTWSDLAARSS